MNSKRRHASRHKDLTQRYINGELDLEADHLPQQQRFSPRSKSAQHDKILRTATHRAEDAQDQANIANLPVGRVVQVYSLYYRVEHQGRMVLCVLRKTLGKVMATTIVVGDQVQFRLTGLVNENGLPEAVIERLLPRQTLLTRSDSFKAQEPQPIVANAQQMLIVASVSQPRVKWGLVDRMLVAAQGGKLEPVICLNKIDLAGTDPAAARELPLAQQVLQHYASMGIRTLQTSVQQALGLQHVQAILKDRTTVLAGHSGVGKSSLIHALQPALDIRIGSISAFTAKGRHTTSSATQYPLDFGGHVIDTPGVKLFGLWDITRDSLQDYFPDLAAGTAPQWRHDSYQRMLQSLPEKS